MSRLALLFLFCVFTVSWITASGLGNDRDNSFSTRKPDTHEHGTDTDTGDDGDDDDAYDDDDDDDDEEKEPELLITSIEAIPYLMVRKDGEEQLLKGEFEGIIPDLLAAICETGHMSCDYSIELVPDNFYGTRDYQGKWTGMIGQVKRQEVDFAAAPLIISAERLLAVNFSVPFDSIALTVIMQESEDIDSLETLLSANITIGGVDGGNSLNRLRNEPNAPYSTMWSTIDSKADSRVENTEAGIDRVLKGGYAFICDKTMGRYYVNRHCGLKQLDETFLPGKGHGFAFPKQNDGLEGHINTAIKELKKNGKIDEIYSTWLDAKCDATGLASLKMAPLLILAAIVLVL